jgi:hypothetical protein
MSNTGVQYPTKEERRTTRGGSLAYSRLNEGGSCIGRTNVSIRYLIHQTFTDMAEFAWIIERLREKKLRVANHIADTLILLWRTDVRTVCGQMTTSLRSQIDEVETVALEEDGYQEDL